MLSSLKSALEEKLSFELTDTQWLKLMQDIVGSESRRNKDKPDLWRSPWGKLLLDAEISIEGSRSNKLFLLRFRVPYVLFRDYIVPVCKQENIFNTIRESYIPIEFKLMWCFRILGRDAVLDNIQELVRRFFRFFRIVLKESSSLLLVLLLLLILLFTSESLIILLALLLYIVR